MSNHTDRDRYNQALETIKDSLIWIELAIAELDLLLAAFKPCDDLDQAAALPADLLPMWPTPPARLALESRNGGKPKYLYVYWHQNPDGTFQGPARQRKLYIGSDPQAKTQAVTLANNCQSYDNLVRIRNGIHQNWYHCLDELDHLAHTCQTTAHHTPRPAPA
jgi:hypothetical protein